MMSKSFYFFFVLFILFSAALHPANAAPTDPVSIPDTHLRAAIETELGKSSGATITEADMAQLTNLKRNNLDIRELTGLEHAINLTELQLIREAPRTLAELDARPRWNLEPLRNLTNLELLNFEGVVIFDMEPLANLTKLKFLSLSSTYGISEIPDLSNLTALVHLNLNRNRLTNIAGVSGLTSLRDLSLSVNPNLSDLSPLTSLSNLEVLFLDGTAITRESLSAVLPAFSTEIDQQQIEEAHPSHGIKSGQLSFENTNISDLSVLDRLPKVFLERLRMKYMGTVPSGTIFFHLTDLTPLVDLMNKGKVINSNTNIYLRYNLGLDYESLYEDIPALIAGSGDFLYTQPTPMLEIEPPPPPMVEIDLQEKTAAIYRGHPRVRYTFSVRAVNEHSVLSPASFSTPRLQRDGDDNRQFEKVPVIFTVTAPDGTQTQSQTRTGSNGLASVSVRLGRPGETHTIEALVPAKTTSVAELSHPPLRVRFTVTADSTAPLPRGTGSPDGLTVTFLDYPQETPIDEFSLTIEFSEPVIGFQEEDVRVETRLDTGTGTATLKALTPTLQPAQTYTATVGLPADATGLVRLIVRKDAAITPPTATVERIGPSSDTPSEFIDFGPALDEDVHFRHPPALVTTKIDFAKGMFWIQNTTQYRFNVEMRIYSEDHKDRWFRISERALIAIEDAETLTFSLTPVETDDPSIIHLNSELLLRMNQNQPLKLSSQKFCIKLMRVIPVDTASNMNEDFRFKETRWDTPGDVIFRQYDASWDAKLQGLRRDHLPYYRFPLAGQLSDSWDVEASVAAAPSVSRVQLEVVLSAFRSTPTESGVVVEWTTALEQTNAGFYVLRSRDRKSGFVRVSPVLIVGTGTATEGQTYRWRDTTAAVNVPYYYRLEGVSLYGERRGLGTVRLRGFISSTGKVLWKWADVKSEKNRIGF